MVKTNLKQILLERNFFITIKFTSGFKQNVYLWPSQILKTAKIHHDFNLHIPSNKLNRSDVGNRI